MGIYLNPGNDSFKRILNDTYVDKTGLLDFINATIDTAGCLTCISRPRRFGKSFAAKMLCAYYDKSCDSRELFQGLRISQMSSYEKYRNRFDVIYLDITWFLSRAKEVDRVVFDIQEAVIEELRSAFPENIKEEVDYLPEALLQIAQATGERFFIIIDEWDAIFRERKEEEALQREYIQLLRGLFKGGLATDVSIAGAYMTGILPIKKYGTQSALTDFREFTMTNPFVLTEYVGFTEKEVQDLCSRFDMDFDSMRQWYDGYSFDGSSPVYNPNSVMSALKFRQFTSYWTKTETYESLKQYIVMNMDGLKDAIITMLGGEKVPVELGTFQNDVTSFANRDDVLTLLIHLGYLAYDTSESEVYIPNLEVADAFRSAVKGADWSEVSAALSQSEQLLKATINGDSNTVAAMLESVHETFASILSYNSEEALACAVSLAYFTARNYYEIIREFPAGKGFADYAFLPCRNADKPAILIELKYNQSADTAIRQIKENRYDGALRSYQGNLLLVGIIYNKDGKEKKRHTCVIEKI